MPNKTTHETTQQALHEIERAIREIPFGSIEITLHEGRVTQIERREKVRLTADRPSHPARVVRAA
ncbi:MAG: YezD family protein [Gallionella sp.]